MLRWGFLFAIGFCVQTRGADTAILKVLTHRLDAQGQHALSPSLYERDAYQAELRTHPERVHGMRFDVNWRTLKANRNPLVLRVELKTANRSPSEPLVLEQPIKRGQWGRRWSALTLDGRDFVAAGEVVAWRAEILEGEQVIAKQESFLW